MSKGLKIELNDRRFMQQEVLVTKDGVGDSFWITEKFLYIHTKKELIQFMVDRLQDSFKVFNTTELEMKIYPQVGEKRPGLDTISPEKWTASHASWLSNQNKLEPPSFQPEEEKEIFAESFYKDLDTGSSLDKQIGGDHYKKYNIQPLEYTMANNLNFCQGNVVKYVTRYKHKNGVQDLLKAIHYLELLIDDEKERL